MQCHSSIHCIVGMFNDTQWVLKRDFFIVFFGKCFESFYFLSLRKARQHNSVRKKVPKTLILVYFLKLALFPLFEPTMYDGGY